MQISPEFTELIVVPAHAPFRADILEPPADPIDVESWQLQGFQYGEQTAYIEHMRRGVELLQRLPNALLVASGGYTREPNSSWSEAATYVTVAEHYNFWSSGEESTDNFADRIVLDENALDSFQNLEEGQAIFKQLMGRKPKHTYAVGWPFKEQRFMYHAHELGLDTNFTYVHGSDDPDDLEGALRGETKTITLFQRNPRGDQGELLAKRHSRDFSATARPELRPLTRVEQRGRAQLLLAKLSVTSAHEMREAAA